MIVKVQRSLEITATKAQMLIYDKTRKHQYQNDLTEEVKQLLGDRLKAYFNAELKNKNFILGEEVPIQNW